MTTIIAQEVFNSTEPSSRVEQIAQKEMLGKILKELQKFNIHMSMVTDEELTNEEIEDDDN